MNYSTPSLSILAGVAKAQQKRGPLVIAASTIGLACTVIAFAHYTKCYPVARKIYQARTTITSTVHRINSAFSGVAQTARRVFDGFLRSTEHIQQPPRVQEIFPDDEDGDEDDVLKIEEPSQSLDQDADVHSDAGSEHHPLEAFEPMLARLKKDKIASYCLRIRQELPDAPNSTRSTDSCLVADQAVAGSYNAAWPITFDDGTKWILKVPSAGHEAAWTESRAQKLLSEVNTMIMLRKETTIPVPQVFSFSSTLDNELACPFILMQLIEGVDLSSVWIDNRDESGHEMRQVVLKELADTMAQLERYSSDTCGCPVFDENAQIIGTVAVEIEDIRVTTRVPPVEHDKKDEYFTFQPSTKLQHYHHRILDRHWKDEFGSGLRDLDTTIMWLVRRFIEWMPQPSTETRKKFVLAHPDLNYQNIIVSEDGHLRGLIDWDGVCFRPRSLGNEQFPLWLVREWDPISYDWEYDTQNGLHPEESLEDSPTALAQYRADYADYMRAALIKLRLETAGAQHVLADQPDLPFYTNNSLLVYTLDLATTSGWGVEYIVQHYLEELTKAHECGHTSIEECEASHLDPPSYEKVQPEASDEDIDNEDSDDEVSDNDNANSAASDDDSDSGSIYDSDEHDADAFDAIEEDEAEQDPLASPISSSKASPSPESTPASEERHFELYKLSMFAELLPEGRAEKLVAALKQDFLSLFRFD